MKDRFRTWLALLSLSFLMLLAACEEASPTAEVDATLTPMPGPTRTVTPTLTATPVVVSGTIRIWHSWQEAQLPALLRAIAAFQEDYPFVLFDVLYVPEIDLRAAFEQASQEGRAPAVLIAPAEWGPELYSAGKVVDVSSLPQPQILNSLNPAAVEGARYQGALVGLPVDLRGVVLYRNAAIIPRSPATFDELVSLAQTATHGSTLGAVLDRSFYFSGAHLFGLGGELVDMDGNPAFNNEAGLEWANLLRDYELAGPTEFFGDSDLTAFKEGRAGMILEGTWRREELAEAIGMQNLAIDPWPVHGGGSLAGFVQSENIFLTPTALVEEHKVSWRFVEYLLTPEAQTAVAEVGMIPAISGSPVSVAASQVIVRDPLIAQAMTALVDGVPYPTFPELPVYTVQLEIALRSIFDGRASPAAALQDASRMVNEALGSATPTP